MSTLCSFQASSSLFVPPLGGGMEINMDEIKVSIIMPVYNVQRYLRQCLDSIVSQTLKEIEIIAVNDGSTDDSLQLLEEYQKNYSDFMEVYSTKNLGVSHARNYGLKKAKGEYILFVDSDDFIEQDMCEKLYHKAVTDQNDLVICGRYNVFENAGSGQLKRELVKTDLINRNFVLSENKYELAHILPFPWDKLFKRELLEGMEFPLNMRFEDLAVIYNIVCKAKYIGVVEEPLYNYRKTTQGGFLNTFSKQTLDIIKAFELVFDFMGQNGYMELYHDELEFICARHFLYRYITLFKQENKGKGKLDIKLEIINKTQDFLDGRLPDWRNNHYLKYSSGWLKKRLPLFMNRKKMISITKVREYMPNKLYNLFIKTRNAAKNLLNKLKTFRRSKSKLKMIKKKLPLLTILAQRGSVYYTGLYNKLKVAPKDILLESKHGEDVAGNIFILLKELSKEAYKEYRVLLAMEPEYKGQYRKLLKNYNINNVTMIDIFSKDYARALATAKYLVTDTSFPPYFIKKKEQVYLNTWHGTPLKAMGRIVPGREYALGNIQRNFLIADYLLYQNDFSKEIFLQDYMLKDIYPGTILVSGYPRNSVFLDDKRYHQIRKECNIDNKQVIVYMPTWRGMVHRKETEKQLRELSNYFEEIDLRLKDSQIFYVKLHPFVKDHMNLTKYQHIQEFPLDYETYDFLNASDALVTDYSSIMFDYGVTKRKIVLFTYDREEYLTGRGLYMDLNSLEFPKADTVEELITALNSEKIEYPKFFEKFCSYDSNNTPSQICEILLHGETKDTEHIKIEKIEKSNRKKIFIFINGLKNDTESQKKIDMINSIDTSVYDVYVCMKTDKVKKNTQMLAKLKKEVAYLPIMYEINYTRMDYILCKLLLKWGINISAFKNRVDKVANRERQKYFGDASFDYIIHHSELDRMVGHLCSNLDGKTIYNFRYFNHATYKKSRAYRRQTKYFIKRFESYDAVVTNKDVKYLKLKANNIIEKEEATFPINAILKEIERHR